MSQDRQKFNWEGLISSALVIATILGVNIPMHLHLDTKLEENRKETNIIITEIRQDIGAIHQEMKDFHGRLCAIEEKNRK